MPYEPDGQSMALRTHVWLEGENEHPQSHPLTSTHTLLHAYARLHTNNDTILKRKENDSDGCMNDNAPYKEKIEK